MANELQTDYLAGKTVYFLLRNATGSIWNGSSFESYNSGNYANYPITASEQGSSGYFVGSMPIIVSGLYYLLAKERVGGSPAETDITVGTGQILWGGTAPVDIKAFFTLSMSNYEGTADKQSLCGAVLKLTSMFDAKDPTNGNLATVYKTDNTVFFGQTVTQDATMIPIRKLGKGT